MNERLFRDLDARRPAIHENWVERLRAAPFGNALAHPETLIHMMNDSIEQVFREIAARPSAAARRRLAALPTGLCRCGMNPLLTYFSTGALAFQHTLAQCADAHPVALSDAEEVEGALIRVARREITVFCAMCRRSRGPAAECPEQELAG
jgi:hypothetical protein